MPYTPATGALTINSLYTPSFNNPNSAKQHFNVLEANGALYCVLQSPFNAGFYGGEHPYGIYAYKSVNGGTIWTRVDAARTPEASPYFGEGLDAPGGPVHGQAIDPVARRIYVAYTDYWKIHDHFPPFIPCDNTIRSRYRLDHLYYCQTSMMGFFGIYCFDIDTERWYLIWHTSSDFPPKGWWAYSGSNPLLPSETNVHMASYGDHNPKIALLSNGNVLVTWYKMSLGENEEHTPSPVYGVFDLALGKWTTAVPGGVAGSDAGVRQTLSHVVMADDVTERFLIAIYSVPLTVASSASGYRFKIYDKEGTPVSGGNLFGADFADGFHFNAPGETRYLRYNNYATLYQPFRSSAGALGPGVAFTDYDGERKWAIPFRGDKCRLGVFLVNCLTGAVSSEVIDDTDYAVYVSGSAFITDFGPHHHAHVVNGKLGISFSDGRNVSSGSVPMCYYERTGLNTWAPKLTLYLSSYHSGMTCSGLRSDGRFHGLESPTQLFPVRYWRSGVYFTPTTFLPYSYLGRAMSGFTGEGGYSLLT